jgi:hypothetical protein
MSKSNMSSIPGVGAMTDTLEFIKNMWGGMRIPGMVMPTLSADDLNKQIADLKAVESWLTLNMNMLRGTIQALEVQSATISTLQSMTAAMNSMAQPNAAKADAAPRFESPFSFAMPTAEKTAVPTPDAEPKTQPAADLAGMVPPFANPAVWWNMLQEQFQQTINSAVAAEPEKESASVPAAPPSRKRKSPSRTKSL